MTDHRDRHVEPEMDQVYADMDKAIENLANGLSRSAGDVEILEIGQMKIEDGRTILPVKFRIWEEID